MRWRHPAAGVLMPARFIQVPEECGQIVKLGRWVLAQACRDLLRLAQPRSPAAPACAWR